MCFRGVARMCAAPFLLLVERMPALYKNFLIVPDSFKGTMSAIDVCRIMAETLQERFPEVHIDTIPSRQSR